MKGGCPGLALAAVLLAGGCSHREVITVAGDRSFEPYEFCAAHTKYATGILVEIWQLMARRNGIRVRYLCYDWNDAQLAVRSGEIDAIGGMVKSTQRQRFFTFVRQLVRNPPQYFYFDTVDYQSEPDFSTLVRQRTPIGVVHGDYAEEKLPELFPGINLKPYASYIEVVKAAERNEIDVFTMEESVASTHLDKLGVTHRFSRSGRSLFHEWLWAAVSNNNPALDAKLGQYFQKITDEEMAGIERKWATSRGGISEHFSPLISWFDDHPVITLVAEVVVPYYLVIVLLYVFRPYIFYSISKWLRALDIPVKLGAIEKIPLRYLLLAFLPDTSRRIIDAVIAVSHESIVGNLSARRTIAERKNLYMVPLVVSGDRIQAGEKRIDASGDQMREQQLAETLQGVFRRPAACAIIHGDGGSGKTSLACWMALRALQLKDPGGQGVIFPNLTVPVFLEGQLSEQKLIDTINGQMNALIDDDIHQDVAVAMLKQGRVVVVVDGLSEMATASRAKFAALDPSMPRFHAVFTSRRREAVFGGIAATEMRPEKLAGPSLAGLFDFYLGELDIRKHLSQPDYFAALTELTKITEAGLLTPLLVAMYARLLAAAVANKRATVQATGIPDLYSAYVNALNARIAPEDRKTDPEVQVSLQRCAWTCVSDSFKPQPVGRLEVIAAIDSDVSRAAGMLEYLEKKLGLIDMQSSPTSVKIVLDPLAEYYAAAHLCDAYVKVEAEWDRFFNFIAVRENLERGIGFAEAVLNTVKNRDLQRMAEPFRAGARERLVALDAALRAMGRSPALDLGEHGVASSSGQPA